MAQEYAFRPHESLYQETQDMLFYQQYQEKQEMKASAIGDHHHHHHHNADSESKIVGKSKLNAQAPEFIPSTPIMTSHSPIICSPYTSSAAVAAAMLYASPASGMSLSAFPWKVDKSPDSADTTPSSVSSSGQSRNNDALLKDLKQKIVKQVEYYFSDANLCANDYLMKFISKDPEGFVPIPVIASFKKIKSFVSNYALIASALRTSSQLVVSEDGKKVRRIKPLSDADIEELKLRTVVAENLPDDHSNEKIEKIFAAVGKVKGVRVCQPQAAENSSPLGPRYSKTDMLLSNKLHALVVFESVEQAEKAVAELNDERNWRSGLRVRLLLKRTGRPFHQPKPKKAGSESPDGTAEEDEASTSDSLNDKHCEESSQLSEKTGEYMVEDQHYADKDGTKRGRGRGRGRVRGCSRGQYHGIHYHNHNNGRGHPVHALNTSSIEGMFKHPPGPRMPDGTRGFTFGRGKNLVGISSV